MVSPVSSSFIMDRISKSSAKILKGTNCLDWMISDAEKEIDKFQKFPDRFELNDLELDLIRIFIGRLGKYKHDCSAFKDSLDTSEIHIDSMIEVQKKLFKKYGRKDADDDSPTS